MTIFRFGLPLFVMIMLTGQAIAADVKVIPSSYIATGGETFEMKITIDPQGAAIAGAQLNIAFDPSNIRINDISDGNFLKQNGAGTLFSTGIIDNSAGTVINIFGVVIGRTSVSAPGTFIIIKATAVGSSGTSGITISNVKISSSDAQPVPQVVYNGSITINGPVRETDILAYYRNLGNDPYYVETTDLLKAVDDWSKDVAPQGFNSPITTQQLLALKEEWSKN
jgi:hypothetical protein